MSRKNSLTFVMISALAIGALLVGCDEDSNYDQRTVVYVASINDNAPYMCDILNQGDSVYLEDGATPKVEDDYIEEDYIKVAIYNKPYSALTSVCGSSLGDFLVTDYDVSFSRLDGAASPVPPFSGETSILVPSGSIVEGMVLLVPFWVKTTSPLVDLQYSANEIMTFAHIRLSGHEVQTDRTVTFETGVTVNFADPLYDEEDSK